MNGAPWFRISLFALGATVTMTIGVLIDLNANGGNSVGLVQPGGDGPSAEVFREDFPELRLPDGLGHDGQQFYAIARQPTDLDGLAERLDRPRYRLQRPLFPALAWALHPSGGGYGLVAAMAAVGVGGLLVGGIGAGALSSRLGGGTWPALLVPLLPGAYAALRLSLADTLALGFVLFSLYFSESGRPRGATAGAILAAFTKESTLVVIVAHAAFRRTRTSVTAAVVSAATTILWWLVLRVLVDADGAQVREFTWPFGGVIRSLDEWFSGEDLIAAAAVLGAFVLAGIALWRRGPGHRLFGSVAASLAFSTILGTDVVGPDFNGPRTIGPMLVLAILMLATPTPQTEPLASA